MSRALLPPTYIVVPIELIVMRDDHGERLPAPVLETWLDFRALAWGLDHSPALSVKHVCDLTGKSRSTLCGHLAILTHWFGLRWQISDNRFQVFFEAEDDCLAAAPSESEKLDSPYIPILKNSVLQFKEGLERVQKAGLGKPRRTDPRLGHPAILACQRLSGYYPHRQLLDRLIAVLGETPDLDRLRQCRQEWLVRGYNPASWKWVVEWYVSGIPPQTSKGEPPHASRHTGGGSGEAEAAPSALARRLSGKG